MPIKLNLFRSFVFFLVAGSSCISYAAQVPNHGNWLVTLSSGGFLGPDATLALRNVLAETFSSQSGGVFAHAVDLDDVTPNRASISKREIFGQFSKLRVQIENFRKANLGRRANVIVGLAAHGVTDSSGLFRLGLPDGALSSLDLLDLLRKLAADSIILVLQSCQSGGLSDQSLVDNYMKEYGSFGLVIVAPVSRFLSSLPGVWEMEILKPSFSFDRTDKNKDGIITYGEWKDSVIATACTHIDFVPEEAFQRKLLLSLPATGLDAHFSEWSISQDFPILMREDSLEHGFDPITTILAEDICRDETAFFNSLYGSDPNGVEKIIISSSGTQRIKAVRALRGLKDSDRQAMTDTIVKLLGDEDSAVRVQAVSLAGGLKRESVRETLINLFTTEKDPQVLTVLIPILSKINSRVIQSVVVILESDSPIELRLAAIAFLYQHAAEVPTPTFMKAFLEGPSPEIQSIAVSALGFKGDQNVSDLLLKRLESNPPWKLKSGIVAALGKLNVQRAIHLIVPLLQPSEWLAVRLAALDAVESMKAEDAVEPLIQLIREESPSETLSGPILFKASAIRSLGALGVHRAASVIRPMLKDINSLVRTAAADSLGKLKDRQSIGELITLLTTDKDQTVRATTIQSLVSLSAKEAVPALRKIAAEDPDPVIQYLANDAIAKLTAS